MWLAVASTLCRSPEQLRIHEARVSRSIAPRKIIPSISVNSGQKISEYAAASRKLPSQPTQLVGSIPFPLFQSFSSGVNLSQSTRRDPGDHAENIDGVGETQIAQHEAS